MIFKLIVAGLSIVGLYIVANKYWPQVYNEAFNLGGFSVSGFLLLSCLLFFGTMKLESS